MQRLILSSLITCFVFVSRTFGEIELRELNTVFIPISVNPDVFEYDAGASEQIAIDRSNHFVYTVGE